MISDLLYRLRALARRATVEKDLDDELRLPLNTKPQNTNAPVFHAERRAGGDDGGGEALDRDGVSRRLPPAGGLRERIREGMVQERVVAMLAGFFGALATVLAMIGLYGLIAYLVALRRNEIGIRLALGARPAEVVVMVVGQAGRLLALGLGIGVLLTLIAGRAASSTSLLFELTPYDPSTLAGACLLLGAIAGVACLLPARRASKLDALVALRHD